MTRVIDSMSETQPLRPDPPTRPALTRPESTQWESKKESLPTLYRDRAFWGLTVTQFLGAFNDSVFKQIVLLLCAQVLVVSGSSVQPMDQQFIAMGIFSIPFVLFSGMAGFWADRTSKRSLIILCKGAEIVVMLAAVAAFALMIQRLSVGVSFTPEHVALTIDDETTANLPIRSDQLGGFTVAGADHNYHDVQPLLSDNAIVLKHPAGDRPRSARWGEVALEDGSSVLHFTRGIPWWLLAVLFLMGTQSAVFGPAKYGILPEMVRARDLPRFNGVIQMTTFLALIFGTAVGGFLLDQYGQALWIVGTVCVGIAVLGMFTSLLVRRTPIAQRDARFRPSSLAVSADTWNLLWKDRSLFAALMVYSLFWFVAAVIPMSVNALGRNELGLSALQTSLMVASISIGIAVGCVLAGKLSSERINFMLVRIGAWGMLICLLLLSLPDGSSRHLLGYHGSQVVLAVTGVFAGLLAVPLQVYLQAKPPDAQKGRTIGAMNLINWIAIILSAGFYFGCQLSLNFLGWPTFLTFGVTALVILLPIAFLYRPANVPLD